MREKVSEHNENIKKIRTKKYFLNAAKEIVIAEGIEGVSIRNVASIAGYSYATLYNYFEDLNALLWEVKQDMIIDLIELMRKETKNITLDSHGLKRLFKLYIRYYVENPNIFEFFYFHKLSKPSSKNEVRQEQPDFDQMMKEAFKGFVIKGELRELDIEVVGKTCIYAVHGMLTLFLSGNGDLTEAILLRDLDRMIDYML